jgi:alkaline phosphatase
MAIIAAVVVEHVQQIVWEEQHRKPLSQPNHLGSRVPFFDSSTIGSSCTSLPDQIEIHQDGI